MVYLLHTSLNILAWRLNMTDIVERIDKLIKGWEREYGITNQTMVDARDTIIRLRSGPGGIMEMKQTISDREAELNECNLSFNAQIEENYLQSLDIERLEKYRDLVKFIANDYVELNYDKAQWQRDDWRKRCIKLIEDHNK